MRAAAIALVLAIGAVTAALIWTMRDRSAPELEGEHHAAGGAATGDAESPDDRGSDSSSSQAEASREEVPRGREGGSSALADADPIGLLGDGSLTVLVRDGASGRPIADLEVACAVESPSDRVLHRARTDSRGIARFVRLPRGIVVVESRRSLPHAAASAAVALGTDEAREIELRVPRGGTVVGRVLDEAREPLAGATVHSALDPRFDGAEAVVATSGEDGTFEIPALLARPTDFAERDGRIEPTRRRGHDLVIRYDSQWRCLGAAPADGEVFELTDVFFKREQSKLPTFAGWVIDRQQRGVPGVLVHAGDERLEGRPLPWDPGWEPRDGEAVTDADGAFALRAALDPSEFTLFAPDGRVQRRDAEQQRWFSSTSDDGSERSAAGFRENLRFVLLEETRVVLDARDDAGAPIDWSEPVSGEDPVEIAALMRDDAAHVSRFACTLRAIAGKGLLSVVFEMDPARVAALEIQCRGFARTEVPLAAPPARDERIPVTLTRLTLHRLSVAFRFASEDDERIARNFCPKLRACLLESGGALADGRGGDGRCCGLGVDVFWEPDENEPVVFELPADEPWTIYAPGLFEPATSERETIALARLAPDDEVQTIRLPPLAAYVYEGFENGSPANDVDAPNAPAERGEIFAEIVDARSGEPIVDSWLGLAHRDPLTVIRLEGTLTELAFPEKKRRPLVKWTNPIRAMLGPGEYRLMAQAPGYHDSAIITVLVRSGDTTDLGVIELEPETEWRARLVWPSGESAITASVSFFEPGSGELDESGSPASSATWITDAGVATDGPFVFRGEMPEQILVAIDRLPSTSARWNARWDARQWVRVDRWSRSGIGEIPVPPLRTLRIEVDRSSLPEWKRELSIRLRLRPLEGDALLAGRHGIVLLDPTDDGVGTLLTFRTHVTPGRWSLESAGGILSVGSQVIDVQEGAGDAVHRVLAR